MLMTTGVMLEETMTIDHHLQDLKGPKMTEAEEEVAEEVQEVEVVMVLEAEEEDASNATKKAIWQEIVQILIKDLVEAEEVEEPVLNATKKAIWQENVQMLINNPKEVEETEVETEEEVEEEAEEAKEIIATNAVKKVTLPKIAQMNLIKMKEDHTRGREEMMEDL